MLITADYCCAWPRWQAARRAAVAAPEKVGCAYLACQFLADLPAIGAAAPDQGFAVALDQLAGTIMLDELDACCVALQGHAHLFQLHRDGLGALQALAALGLPGRQRLTMGGMDIRTPSGNMMANHIMAVATDTDAKVAVWWWPAMTESTNEIMAVDTWPTISGAAKRVVVPISPRRRRRLVPESEVAVMVARDPARGA